MLSLSPDDLQGEPFGMSGECKNEILAVTPSPKSPCNKPVESCIGNLLFVGQNETTNTK